MTTSSRRPIPGYSDKPKNSSTCTPCRLRRVRCNREKPCSMCINRGIGDQCDSPMRTQPPYLQRTANGPGLRNEIDRIRRMTNDLERLRPQSTVPQPSLGLQAFPASYPLGAASTHLGSSAPSLLNGTSSDGGFGLSWRGQDHVSLANNIPAWLGSTYRPSAGSGSASNSSSTDTSAFFASSAGGSDMFPVNNGADSYSFYATNSTSPYSAYYTNSDGGHLAAALNVQSQADRKALGPEWEAGRFGGSKPTSQPWSFDGY